MSSISHLKLHDGYLYILATLMFMVLVCILYCTYKYVDRAVDIHSRRNSARSSAVPSRSNSLYLHEEMRPLTMQHYGHAIPLPLKHANFGQMQIANRFLTEREKEILQIRCEECESMSQATNSSILSSSSNTNYSRYPPTMV